MLTTDEIVSLAEWIIDDIILVFLIDRLKRSSMRTQATQTDVNNRQSSAAIAKALLRQMPPPAAMPRVSFSLSLLQGEQGVG